MDFKSLMPFPRSSTPLRSTESMDPFLSLRREMDRMFEDFTREWRLPTGAGHGFLTPKVDLVETDTGIELTAELPGLAPEDIALDIEDDTLTLKAERREEKEEKDDGKHYRLVERSTGTYLRHFALPFEPDRDKVTAEFDKGLLKVVVPRSPQAPKKATHIDIKAA